MDSSIISDFDEFMKVVSATLSNYHLLEHEINELKAELDTSMKTVDSLKQYMEKKEESYQETQNEKLRISQEITQTSYDSGKLMRTNQQLSKCKYEVRTMLVTFKFCTNMFAFRRSGPMQLEVANTRISTMQREISILRTENERNRKHVQIGPTNTNSNISSSKRNRRIEEPRGRRY